MNLPCVERFVVAFELGDSVKKMNKEKIAVVVPDLFGVPCLIYIIGFKKDFCTPIRIQVELLLATRPGFIRFIVPFNYK